VNIVVPTLALTSLTLASCQLLAPLSALPSPPDGAAASDGSGAGGSGSGGDGGGSDGGGHDVSASGACSPEMLALPFPASGNGVLDGFDTDGPPSPEHWVTATDGDYAVQGGRLASQGGWALWTTKLGATQEVYAKFAGFNDFIYDMSLVMKTQYKSDNCENLRIRFSLTIFRGVTIGYCTQSNLIEVVNDPGLLLEAGQEVGARAFPNGCVAVYIDRQLVLSKAVDGFPWNARGGYVGVYTVTVGNDGPANPEPTVWDDFGAGNFAGP